MVNSGQAVAHIFYQTSLGRTYIIKKGVGNMTKQMAIYLLESKHVYLTHEGRRLLTELLKSDNNKAVTLDK